MPWVTGSTGNDNQRNGKEHGQYLCDYPGCSNVAKHVMGCVKEIGMFAAVCDTHAKRQPTIRDYRWTIALQREAPVSRATPEPGPQVRKPQQD